MAKVTEEQVIEAVERLGSNRKAAKELGVDSRAIDRRMVRLIKRGYSPKHDMTHMVPEGYLAKGVSTYYNKDGKPTGQWVKSAIDSERQEALVRAAIEAMSEQIQRAEPVPPPATALADLVNLYVITDYHLGMLAWHEETGDDWDTEIAEDLLVRWFELAIRKSPNARVGIFGQLGDLLHWDGMDAVTPASRHLLDADTRFQKLVRVVIRVLRRIIRMLLEKHEVLHIVMAEGNHDPASSIWLRELLSALYEDEPRVTVDLSPDPYYCFEFGQTSLFFHHGHKRKPANVDTVFVAKFRALYGRTQHSYAHMGHMHHIDAKESTLMVVEQHRTLAASDAYASRGGWMSGRDAQVITYHREFGETERLRISSKMAECG